MADKEPEPLLARAAAAVPAGEALDVACGIGRHTLWLLRQGWHVTAVDYSEIALARVEENTHGLPVRIVRADIEAGEFHIEPRCYDLIVDTCFLHRPLFPAMREGVREGGVFFGVYPLEGDTRAGRPYNPAYLIAPCELRSYFEGWEILLHNEGRPAPDRRLRAEIVARKPLSAE